MSQLIFGAGDFYGTPLTDANGNTIANPTPIKIGGMQEMSIDFSGDIKEAFGQGQFALAVARGKTKIAGKIKGVMLNGQMLNNLFFGQTLTAGTLNAINSDTTGAAIPATPFQITPVPPSSGTWAEDLGVLDTNGIPFTRVASAPATGQYSVAAGVYTFATADTAKTVYINYRYTSTLAAAKKISIVNLPMGAAPSFKAFLSTVYQGKRALVVLNSVVAPKLHLMGTKLDDFSMPELDFQAQDPGSGQIGDVTVSE